MTKSATKPKPSRQRRTLAKSDEPAPWFIKEWLAFKKLRQADITRVLGWEPGRVSKLLSGKQTYTGSDLAVLARWLQVEPHELLMKPKVAESLRRLRIAAHDIVEGGVGEV